MLACSSMRTMACLEVAGNTHDTPREKKGIKQDNKKLMQNGGYSSRRSIR